MFNSKNSALQSTLHDAQRRVWRMILPNPAVWSLSNVLSRTGDIWGGWGAQQFRLAFLNCFHFRSWTAAIWSCAALRYRRHSTRCHMRRLTRSALRVISRVPLVLQECLTRVVSLCLTTLQERLTRAFYNNVMQKSFFVFARVSFSQSVSPILPCCRLLTSTWRCVRFSGYSIPSAMN